MKRVAIAYLLVALAALPLACSSTEGGHMAQSPSSPALAMRLSDAELSASKVLAGNGDCAAALKVARHYSFVKNDFAESITWLRIAAKCPAPEPKAELVYLLLGGGKIGPRAIEEIEVLVTQIRASNPGLADEVSKEVLARLGKPNG